MLSMTLAPIDRQEAFRYMGCFGEPDPNLAALADQCERELIQKTHPGVIYRVLPLQRQDSRLLAGALELPGEDIRRLLQDCSRVLLMKNGRVARELLSSETTVAQLEADVISGEEGRCAG